jgi:hypothetical protein
MLDCENSREEEDAIFFMAWIFFFFFFLVVLGFGTQGVALAVHELYCLSHTPALFVLILFSDGYGLVLLFGTGHGP